MKYSTPWILPAFVLAFFFVLVLSACSDKTPEPLKLSGQTMGTTWSAVVVVPKGRGQTDSVQTDSVTITKELEQVLKQVNDQMSTWQKDSELSLFNQYSGTEWFEVSPELVRVVQAAAEISETSGGVYDVTVGPLVNLWGFGAGKKDGTPTVPEQSEITATLAKVGYQKLEARVDPPALRKSVGEVYVDLSSIAKGHGVDKLAEYLKNLGFNDFMVEIGGEIHVQGNSPRGDAWRIAVEKPVALGSTVQQGLNLQQGGLATSGDYRNFFTVEDKRYSHTIDPLSGKPVTHSLASVSVMAENTMLADGYATLLMALGEEKGRAFALENGIEAYFIWRTDDSFDTFATDGFKQSLLNKDE